MDLSVVDNLGYGKLYFANNRVEINIEAAPLTIVNRSGLRYYLIIKTPAFENGDAYINLPAMDAVEEPLVNAGGVLLAKGAFFEIDKILKSLLGKPVPVFGQKSILSLEGVVAPFKLGIEVADIIAGEGVEGTNFETDVQYVIAGGLSEHVYEEWKEDFWGGYLKNKFLSWKPSWMVMEGEPVVLCFLNNLLPTPQALKLRVYRLYTDGTEDGEPETMLVQATQYMKVYSVPVGLKIVQKSKEVASYMVWLVNEENKVVSERVTYTVDRAAYEDVRFVVFRNSLGGFDTLPIVGSVVESLRVSKDVSDVYRPFEAKASYSERNVNKVTGVREIALSTGWLNDDERAWLEELALSEQVYIATDRDLLPMTLIDDGVVSYDTQEDLIGRTLVFEYTNMERNYSKLPKKAVSAARATKWIEYGYGACILDGFGKRTGYAYVTHLVKVYADNNTVVKPLAVTLNTPGKDGYILKSANVAVACAATPYVNVAYSAIGTYKKMTCGVGYYGTGANIAIAAGRWGSEDSQAAADARAVTEWSAINTQAYADANGSCVLLSAGGLRARYYGFGVTATSLPPDTIYDGTAALSNVMSSITVSDASLTSLGVGADYVALRAEGYIKSPITGLVTFYFNSDDGKRVWMSEAPVNVDANLILKIDNWLQQGATENSFVLNMVAGEYYKVRIDYFEYNGAALLEGNWSYAGQVKTLIPTANLYYE